MNIIFPKNLTSYELLDSGLGKRLERFGEYTLVRPDPQCIWKPKLPHSEWDKADAYFEGKSDKGRWVKKNSRIPDKWVLNYQKLTLEIRLSPFKHTGIFPEQAAHWEFIEEKIKASSTQPNVLNLFAYTGIASLVAAEAGAKVTHIDASYPTIGWAKENQKLSKLEDKPIRWILDDCIKFVQREIKRGVKYDGIILDPPVYGHGPNGEIWDFNVSFPVLLDLCVKLLSQKPLFIIINAYAISSSAIMLENVLKDLLQDGIFESGELALQEKSGRLLSTGIFTRWSNE